MAEVQGLLETVIVKVTVLPASPAADVYVGVSEVPPAVIDPAPFSVHNIVPLEEVAAPPGTVYVPPAQMVPLPPAVAVGGCLFIKTTVLEFEAQGALLIVHVSVVEPVATPVTVELKFPGEVITTPAHPPVQVQAPVPTAGLFPASVKLPLLQIV